jgi:hypothetical protein
MARSLRCVAAAAFTLVPSLALAHDPTAGAFSMWICVAVAAAVGIPMKRLLAPPGRPDWARLALLGVAETIVGVVVTGFLFSREFPAFVLAGVVALGVLAALHAIVLRPWEAGAAKVLVLTVQVPLGAALLLLMGAPLLYVLLE